MSTPRDYTVALVAGTPHEIGAVGRFFGIIEAPTGAIDVSIDGGPNLRRGAGGSIIVASSFKRIRLSTVANQTARVLIADDVQDVSNIVTAAGTSITVEETPSATIDTPADNAIAAATTEAIAANAARLRITIGVLSTETVPLRVQAAGAVDLSGIEIQPGQFVEFRTTAALDIRNNDAAVASRYYVFEES